MHGTIFLPHFTSPGVMVLYDIITTITAVTNHTFYVEFHAQNFIPGSNYCFPFSQGSFSLEQSPPFEF